MYKDNRGNPNLKKGCPSLNPAGRPKGSLSVRTILRAATILHSKKKHPIEQLIRLAEKSEARGDYKLASEIWVDIQQYCEPKKKAIEVAPEKPTTPAESLEAAEATMQMIKDLENGTNLPSNQSSVDTRTPEVSAEASPEENLRCSEGEQGTDLHSELLPASGEVLHDGSDVNGDCNTKSESTAPLRSPVPEPS